MPEPPQSTPGWARVLLGFACIAAIAGAILVVGPAASAPQSSRRVITVEKGVVQSTVSGSGTLQPAQQLNVNFKASGTLLAVDVRSGQHVYQGQLLAELDPQAATVGVQQAQANLAAANAKLAQVRSDPTTSAASSAGGSGSNQTAGAASTSTTARTASIVRPVATSAASTTTPAPTTAPAPAAPTGTTSTPATAKAPAEPKAATVQPAATTKKAAPKQTSTATQNTTAAAATVSPATKAANIAAAVASVASANLSLKSAQIALDATKLYAPASGTIASLSGAQPGDAVSAGATGAAPAAASSTGTSATGGGGTGSSAGSSSSSSSAFIVLVDLSGMDVVVPMGEADITKVRSGQPATVTVNAIPGSELGAHVTAVATLPTTTSGVVSYDVTLRLDQLRFGVRPGMTAAAQLIVSQAQGAVSLPSAAISRSGGQTTVTVVRAGKDVVQPVVTGIVGDSATQIVSGLTAGEQVAIATATNLGSSAAGGAGAGLGGATRALGGGGGGGGFGLGAGGGGARRGGG